MDISPPPRDGRVHCGSENICPPNNGDYFVWDVHLEQCECGNRCQLEKCVLRRNAQFFFACTPIHWTVRHVIFLMCQKEWFFSIEILQLEY